MDLGPVSCGKIRVSLSGEMTNQPFSLPLTPEQSPSLLHRLRSPHYLPVLKISPRFCKRERLIWHFPTILVQSSCFNVRRGSLGDLGDLVDLEPSHGDLAS